MLHSQAVAIMKKWRLWRALRASSEWMPAHRLADASGYRCSCAEQMRQRKRTVIICMHVQHTNLHNYMHTYQHNTHMYIYIYIYQKCPFFGATRSNGQVSRNRSKQVQALALLQMRKLDMSADAMSFKVANPGCWSNINSQIKSRIFWSVDYNPWIDYPAPWTTHS